MQTLSHDLRYALRQLRTNPGFALVTVLTLALGIGANTAIFSLVEGVLLRPLPYTHADRLVHLGTWPQASGDDVRFSVLELADYRRQTGTLAAIMEYHSMTFNLTGRGDPEQVQTGVVSANFFSEMGIQPLAGRTFRPGDEQPGAPPVLLLSYGYWRDRLGGDPAIVGQTFRMNEREITAVGVLPPLPPYPGKDDLFIPTSACPFRASSRVVERRESRMLRLLGRVRPGAPLPSVAADVSTIAHRLHQAYPGAYKQASTIEVPVTSVREELTQRFRPTLLVLLGTVGMMLLLCCASVANLALARLVRRDREMVVRAALGARRQDLVRQLLTESTLLAVLAGAAGLLLSLSTMRLLVAFAARFTPRASEIGIDVPVLLFTLAVSLATGLAFGMLPALQASRRDIAASLKEASGQAALSAGGRRTQAALVMLQVAVACILLVGAGLTLRTVVELQRVELGFQPEKVVTMTITLPSPKYQRPADSRRFFGQLLARLAAHPGVLAVAIGTDAPLTGGLVNPTLNVENHTFPPDQEPTASVHSVSPEYFRVLGIPLLQGRMLGAMDHEKAPPAVLANRALAQQLWPGEDPVGKRIAFTGPASPEWRTVVGVVGNVKQHGLEESPGSGLYLPFLQAPVPREQLLVRAAASAEAIAREVRGELRQIDPEQPIADVRTLAEVRTDLIAPYRLTAILLCLFAGLAFVITATAVGGMIAFYVGQRTQEIGIRAALGARPEDLLGLVLRQGMKLVAAGLLLGVAGALFLSRWLGSLLFATRPQDPVIFALAPALIFLVAFLACLLPLRHAMKLDPVAALRAQ
jgi:putative ABC transport system permease protein